MKTSCIKHPVNMPLVVVRADYKILLGHIGAVVVLSIFEYFHNIKLEQQHKAIQANDIAQNHGDGRFQDETLLQFHTLKELQDLSLGIIGRLAITEGIKILKDNGFITVHKNPNPRYKFDKTNFFLLHPNVINKALASLFSDYTQIDVSNNQNSSTEIPNKVSPNTKTDTPITEITSKITSLEGKRVTKSKDFANIYISFHKHRNLFTEEQTSLRKHNIKEFLKKDNIFQNHISAISKIEIDQVWKKIIESEMYFVFATENYFTHIGGIKKHIMVRINKELKKKANNHSKYKDGKYVG